MGKLPYGPVTPHVSRSMGPDANIMKFYITSNSSTYGRSWDKFNPRMGRHTGTGYLSNFRPGVYYSPRLDTLDNPVMGRLVADNYHSITDKSFKPYRGPDGREPLPSALHQVGSGFIRQKPITAPTAREVTSVCIDTRASSAPADIQPRNKPYLHTIRSRDPVELENGGYGPGFMTTETHERFRGEPSDRKDLHQKDVGPGEGSGYSHAYNVEPVTFHPDYAHKGDRPGWMTYRPTGTSIMQTSYQPSQFMHGGEALPFIANRSEHDTGHTRGTKARPVFVNRVMGDAYDKAGDMPGAVLDHTRKNDPAEYLNMTNPNNYSSIAKATFKGQQRPGMSASDRLERTSMGNKELTGYCENNDRFIQTDDDSRRFITHYGTKFGDNAPRGKDREGHTWGHIQRQKTDGFTKSTQVHSYGADINATATLRRLEPYVAKSLKASDPFIDDHTHDAKRLQLSMVAT